ncbi:hypothetical protein LEP1GSC088_1804 [Leptospira interrogans str. L1207]|nr:hypothetical protein LEP1GSC088_1804 [Leptospira interrogans str. L1207]
MGVNHKTAISRKNSILFFSIFGFYRDFFYKKKNHFSKFGFTFYFLLESREFDVSNS